MFLYNQKMNCKKLLGVSILGLLSIGVGKTSPVFAAENSYTNIIGEIDYLVNGDTIEYSGTLSDTIEIYITSNALGVNNEININLDFNNFILANVPNNGEAFHIYNSTQYTVNVTFIVSGQNNRIYSGNDMAPIYLEATNGTSGDINTIWTMGDTSCDTNAELTLGTDNENIQMVSMITRNGCNGTDKLKNCTTEYYLAEATDDFDNHDVYPYETFNLWGNTGHVYDDEDIQWYYSDVPCQEEGYWEVDCQKCERTLHYSIPLDDHNWEYADEEDEEGYKAPTCTENGYHDKTCTICFETEREVLQATGHTLPSIPSEYVDEPTCTQSGTAKYICTVCGEPVIQEVDPIPDKHNWSDWEITVEEDCTHDGSETRACLDCGETQTEVRPAHHLLLDDDRIEVSGTCLNRGYFQYTCQRCGEVVKSYFDDNPYNHEGSPILVVDTPSTETTTGRGHMEWSCCHAPYSESGADGEQVVICKEGEHNWEYNRTIEYPTCTEEGLDEYKCSICGLTKEAISEPQHSYQETRITQPPCITKGSWGMICSECGDVQFIEYEDYDPDTHEGNLVTVVDVPSTEDKEGEGHYEWDCCHQTALNEEGNIQKVTICKTNEHMWNLYEEIKPGTCTKEGLGIFKCGMCGLTKEDHYYGHVFDEKRFAESTCITPGSWGLECSICQYRDPNYIFYDELDPDNHEGAKKLVVDEAATTERTGRGHYEWSCCGAKVTNEEGNVEYVTIPKLTKDTSKDILTDMVVGTTQSGEAAESSAAEAIEKASEDTLLDIVVIANQAFDNVANLSPNNVTEEQKQTYVENIQAATESAVIAGSKLDNSADEAASITINLPERALPNFEEILRNFYSIQYDTILGRRTGRQNAPTTGGITITGNIDYELEASKYRAAVDCINTTVDHMAGAAGLIRVCSNEKISTLVNNYIEQIGVRSFREFDKKKADLEFAEKAYEAILVNMQNQTIATLTESYENLSKSAEGTALDALTEEYNAQLAACKDIGQFEWLVVEIMRQKYNTFLNEQYFNNAITYEEYKARFIPEGEASLVKFKDIYKEIFYKWALGDDAITYGYTEDYGITLQELTDTTIKTVSLKEKPIELSKAPTPAEITVAVVFGTLCLLTAGALVTLEVLKKKKGVVAA